MVQRQTSAKLLGMTLDENRSWKTHVSGTGGVISSLNKRLFVIRKLKNHLNQTSIIRVAESIFTSKIRYGLQMLGKVRWKDSDRTIPELKEIQLVQNKMLRLLNNVKISDRKRSAVLAKNINALSVNQLNAQIKITEMWKAINEPNYPLKFKNKNTNDSAMISRSKIEGKLLMKHGSDNLKATFKNDGITVWNNTPENVKRCKSILTAKKYIKDFVNTLPF